MFKRLSLIVLLCALVISGFSQRVFTREEYIQKYRTLAVHEMQRCGIPASIKLAQACHESGNGNSVLAQKSNNHFGIKCKSNWTGGRVFHNDDLPNECFRKYNSVEESFIDHSNFLVNNARYGELFKLNITDYKGWARGLKKAGYATAPQYPEMLIKIIEDNKLYLYDQLLSDQQLEMITTADNAKDQAVKNLINPYQPRKVVFRNGLKSIVVQAGDSPQSITEEFNMKVWELYKYNDLPNEHRLQVNEILYIVPKRSTAIRSFEKHTIQPDESMHYVSQRYGIKLKKLYKLNNMKYDDRPVAGTVLYLRERAPK